MINKQITISIIVPVHNVESYVRKSLQSVVDQTFKDWECIVIDDGSTDGSGAICDEFAASDPRFRVIHQSNQGLPASRNVGLDLAQGEYIAFLDSDDCIHPDMYQVLLDAIRSNQADLAICLTRKVNSLEEEFLPNPPIAYQLKNRDQLFSYWFMEPFTNSLMMDMAWNKLYSRELIGRERNVDLTPGQDREFNMRLYLRCGKAVLVNQVLHHWLQRQGSISKWGIDRRSTAVHRMANLKVWDQCGELNLQSLTDREKGYLYIKVLKGFFVTRMAATREPDIMRQAKEVVKKYLSPFFSSKTIPLKYKAVMGAMYYCPWLSSGLYTAFINFCEIKAKITRKLNRQ